MRAASARAASSEFGASRTELLSDRRARGPRGPPMLTCCILQTFAISANSVFLVRGVALVSVLVLVLVRALGRP